MRIFLSLFSLLLCGALSAQLYVKKQSRHRFAQINFGVDYQTSLGGSTQFQNAEGQLADLEFDPLGRVRLLIGGTHFWGHADFLLAIPVTGSEFSSNGQELNYQSGTETIFKFYPFRIEHNRIRPYVGFSIAPNYFEQDNGFLEFGNGPELNHTSLPLVTGLTFNAGSNLFEAGLSWNYANEQEYFINRTTELTVTTPPLFLHFSFRRLLDSTLPNEPQWESGETAKIVEAMAAKGKLNSFYLGAGLSSAFWLEQSSYNQELRPYVEKYSTSIMPDFTLGYYLHQPDLNFALSYRRYGSSTNSYGTIQNLNRRSFVLEATKYLFDYHGFAPFLGPAVSAERLSFTESFERQLTQDVADNLIDFGLTFGWDIRPDRRQWFILRTNLRWFPGLDLAIADGREISFGNIEFNFIQFVLFPNRLP